MEAVAEMEQKRQPIIAIHRIVVNFLTVIFIAAYYIIVFISFINKCFTGGRLAVPCRGSQPPNTTNVPSVDGPVRGRQLCSCCSCNLYNTAGSVRMID